MTLLKHTCRTAMYVEDERNWRAGFMIDRVCEETFDLLAIRAFPSSNFRSAHRMSGESRVGKAHLNRIKFFKRRDKRFDRRFIRDSPKADVRACCVKLVFALKGVSVVIVGRFSRRDLD